MQLNERSDTRDFTVLPYCKKLYKQGKREEKREVKKKKKKKKIFNAQKVPATLLQSPLESRHPKHKFIELTSRPI